MGLFDRLFKPDPRVALERAESLLARGDAVEALRLAERAARGASLAQNGRAQQVVRRAKDALADAALERAALAEESGFLADAAEWIGAALDHVVDEGRRGELEGRAADLLERAAADERRRRAAAEAADLAYERPEDEGDDEALADGQAVLDAEGFYGALVDMLDDDVAERYEERPEAFRRAFVQLNEGQVRQALPALEELAESHPGDPVYVLERGRCRLLLGDYAGARRDLEDVWEVFGDEPLDRARSMSVPGLWAEAMLGLDLADELIERLDEVAVPRDSDANLCHHYALALMVAERFEEARSYLLEAINFFPQEPELPRQLAAALHRLGRTPEAIATLERAVAPSCATGTCRRPPKHVPSLRSLAGLHLEAGHLDRVHELMTHVAQALDGKLEGEDYLLLAEYHQQRGNAEAASEAAARARSLRDPQAAPAS